MSARRLYRHAAGGGRFKTFSVTVKESDLWIAVPRKSFYEDLPGQVEQLLWRARRQLETYIAVHPDFAVTLEPFLVREPAPAIALEMARAGNICGVGPMAAVAGALAEIVGQWLLRDREEVIVENGGDIFLKVVEALNVAILAGKSPLSGKIALLVEPEENPLGISTASGTAGHSFSKGRADAAVILSPSAALADAAATAVGNLVQGPADLERALALARSIEGVTGAVLICGDKMALWGQVQIRPLQSRPSQLLLGE
ncbi:MAG TPA: UPF0280 family protein [Bacillota bacterium]|jgi:ApbE superfamily uncharacterized protein (UPF0280 family)|nr:UPF0280 family protein [Bacillota bacterium]HOA34713.1 UPF0280 family protein [Bacillota bacterium]HOJ84329.1 UPF0280 family protein [Bacillota bacterium]HOL15886.1 UPF0280 family protein [Bacillota bacterium]HPZ11181.1 UPF0280 family protein [Bacillota bacterium]